MRATQKFGEHEQASTRLNFASKSSKGKILRAVKNFNEPFITSSVTKEGIHKNFGGDAWRVYIREGPASLAPQVWDHDNGVYEVVFLVMEPDNYSAHVTLDFTLCDGLRDPPVDWIIKGLELKKIV